MNTKIDPVNPLVKPMVALLRQIEHDSKEFRPILRPIEIPAYVSAVKALRAEGVSHIYNSKIIDCYIQADRNYYETDENNIRGTYHVEVTVNRICGPDTLTMPEKYEVAGAAMSEFHNEISKLVVDDFNYSLFLSNGECIDGESSPNPGFVEYAEMVSRKKIDPDKLPF